MAVVVMNPTPKLQPQEVVMSEFQLEDIIAREAKVLISIYSALHSSLIALGSRFPN